MGKFFSTTSYYKASILGFESNRVFILHVKLKTYIYCSSMLEDKHNYQEDFIILRLKHFFK